MSAMPKSAVSRAIYESVTQDKIVTIEGDAETCAELFAACDDSVKTSYDRGPDAGSGVLVEYWGTDGDGDEWRVHVEVQS